MGVKLDWLVDALLSVDKTELATAWPLTFHANVIESLSASVAFALRVIEAGMATTAPVALGVWLEHTGGVFFVTVQLRVAVLVPLSNFASNVLAPELNCEDRTLIRAEVLARAEPFNFHETAQVALLGVTANGVDVAAAAATRAVAVEGEVEVKAQSF